MTKEVGQGLCCDAIVLENAKGFQIILQKPAVSHLLFSHFLQIEYNIALLLSRTLVVIMPSLFFPQSF